MRSSAKLRRACCLLIFVSLTWKGQWSTFATARRATLLQLGSLTLSAPALAETPGMDVYFGQGCFWHVQRDMVQLESQLLDRKSGNEVTSIAGYAGGSTQGKKPVCYHNLNFPLRDYSRLGHAEAVKVSQVPESQIGAFAKAYLDSVVSEQPAGRPDSQDVGAEYRAMIGLPGGANSTVFPDIVAANAGRLKLAVGQGSDPDTADTQVVWIYDSEQFPFYQAELYHQFHDDMGAKYPASYKSLKDGLLKKGRLQSVSCPEEEFSEEAPEMADDPLNFGAAGPDPFDKVIGIFKDPNPPEPKKTGKKRFEKSMNSQSGLRIPFRGIC